LSMEKNKFIVFEGIDGSGGETQANILVETLKKQGIDVVQHAYPDYTGPIAQLIHDYLHNKYEFSKEVQFLLYFADFLKDKEKIQQWLGQGKTIVADRYFTTTIAYQCLNGVPLDNALQIAQMFQLPVPDKVLLLDISAETSIERKTKEKDGNLDRNESSKQFLADLASLYRELAAKNAFGQWTIINGEQTIEKVTEDVIQILHE